MKIIITDNGKLPVTNGLRVGFGKDCCGGVYELHLLQYQFNRRDEKFQFTDSEKCGVLLRLVNGADYQYRTRYLGPTVYTETEWDGNNCQCVGDILKLTTVMNPFYRILYRDPRALKLAEDQAKAAGGVWHRHTNDKICGLLSYYKIKRVGTGDTSCGAAGGVKCAASRTVALGVQYEDDDRPDLPRQPLFAVARVKVVLTGTGDAQTANIEHKLYGLFRGEPVGYRAYRKDADGLETWGWVDSARLGVRYLAVQDDTTGTREYIQFVPLGFEGDLAGDSPLVPALQDGGLLRIDQTADDHLFGGGTGLAVPTSTRAVSYPFAGLAASLGLPPDHITQNDPPTAYESATPNPDAPLDAPRAYTVHTYKMVRERIQVTDSAMLSSAPPDSYSAVPNAPQTDHVVNHKWYEYQDTIMQAATEFAGCALGDLVDVAVGDDSLHVGITPQVFDRWCLGKRTRDGETETRIYYYVKSSGDDPDPPSDNWNPDQTDADYAKKVWLFFGGEKRTDTPQPCPNYSSPAVICDWLPLSIYQGFDTGGNDWSISNAAPTPDTPLLTYQQGETVYWYVLFHALDYIDTYYDDQAYNIPYADPENPTWPEMNRLAAKDCQRWSEQATAWGSFKATLGCADPVPPTPDPGAGYYKWVGAGIVHWHTSFGAPLGLWLDAGDRPGNVESSCVFFDDGPSSPPNAGESGGVPQEAGPWSTDAPFPTDQNGDPIPNCWIGAIYNLIGGWTKAGCPVYTPPDPPYAACCLKDGSCVSLTEEGCKAAGGNWHGEGSYCGDGSSPTSIECNCCKRKKRSGP